MKKQIGTLIFSIAIMVMTIPANASSRELAGAKKITKCMPGTIKYESVTDQCYEVPTGLVYCCDGAGTERYSCSADGEWVMGKVFCFAGPFTEKPPVSSTGGSQEQERINE